MRVRLSSFARLLAILVALCLILGGAYWPRAADKPRADAIPHFETATSTIQVWVTDQPTDSASVPVGPLHASSPLSMVAILGLWIGILSGRAFLLPEETAPRVLRPAEALAGVVELRL